MEVSMQISSLPHGCVGVGPERPIQVLDWFGLAADHGLDGVEVMDNWVMRGVMESTDHALMDAIGARLAALPLHVSAFINHGPHVWDSEEINRRELDKARLFMDWAVALGTRIFRVTTAVRPEGANIPDAQAMVTFAGMIETLLPEAEQRGLVIGLEEHPGFAGTTRKMAALLEHIPDRRFGIAYDMKNTLREGEAPTDLFLYPGVLDRVLYTHVDNFKQTPSGWDRSVTLDAGVVDIRRMVLGLRAHGYDGWLSVEYGGKDLEQVFKSIAWLRGVWGS